MRSIERLESYPRGVEIGTAGFERVRRSLGLPVGEQWGGVVIQSALLGTSAILSRKRNDGRNVSVMRMYLNEKEEEESVNCNNNNYCSHQAPKTFGVVKFYSNIILTILSYPACDTL